MNNRTIVLLAVKSISRETFVPRTMTQGRVLQPGTRRAVTVEEDPVIDTVSIINELTFKNWNFYRSLGTGWQQPKQEKRWNSKIISTFSVFVRLDFEEWRTIHRLAASIYTATSTGETMNPGIRKTRTVDKITDTRWFSAFDMRCRHKAHGLDAISYLLRLFLSKWFSINSSCKHLYDINFNFDIN